MLREHEMSTGTAFADFSACETYEMPLCGHHLGPAPGQFFYRGPGATPTHLLS